MTTTEPSEAMTTKSNQEYFGRFPARFKKQAHLLVHWGYEDARHEIQHPENDQDREESITGLLAVAIEDWIDASDQAWCKHYSVHDDPPIETEGRSGRSRYRADLIIKSTSEGGSKYIFEAKRLKKNRHLSDYTGPDGMGCFISGKYAGKYYEAGMLGYVQSDGLAEWKDKVKNKINQDAEKLSLMAGSQRDKRVIDAFPLEWVSEHNRNSVGRPITIYHILLDCCVE